MTSVYDILFVIQLLTVIIITLLKVFNLMNKGEFYDIRVGGMLFILFIIAFFLGQITIINYTDITAYYTIFTFESLIFPLQFIFMFVELALVIKSMVPKRIMAYHANKK